MRFSRGNKAAKLWRQEQMHKNKSNEEPNIWPSNLNHRWKMAATLATSQIGGSKGALNMTGNTLFLDVSAYTHLEAFKPLNSVKLLLRNQVLPCGPPCPSLFFLKARPCGIEVAWHTVWAIPHRAQVKRKGGKESRLNVILKKISLNQCIFLPCS